MNLKFHACRTALRFFYVYFLNDKQQQSNSIRRFCKEYDIEIQDTPSVSTNPLEEITNDDISNFDASDHSNLDLAVPSKKQIYGSKRNEVHLSQSSEETSSLRFNRKRKSDQFTNSTTIDQENAPPRKRITRSTKRK